MTVQAVVFDIGNVLIEWNPERFYDATLGEERRRAMFEAVPILAMNERVDLGAVWAEEVAALAERHPDWAEPISHWHHRWIEMASPEIPRSVRLLRALRGRGVSVFALSNFGRETFAHALAHYPFLAEFDRAFVSGHLALAKPDAAIYEAVERDSGVAPGAIPAMLTALRGAAEKLQILGVPLDGRLGDWQVEPRNGVRIPIHGGNGNQEGTYGSITMRTGLTSSGYVGVHWGQSYLQTVTFDEQGPVAQAMLTYGQSTDPKSPWYADQTQMYSRKQWPVLPFAADKIKADPNYATVTLRE